MIKERKNHHQDITTAVKPKLSGFLLMAIVAFIISLLIGLLIYKFTSGYFEEMAMVKRSSNTRKNVEVVLPDGSKVWLNKNSEVRFPKEFGPNKREAFFEGEAFFAIVKNEEKPFILHSIKSRIEVVGTTFNLRAYPDERELILNVISGEVILFDKKTDKNAIQLENGEQGVFNYETRKIKRLNNDDINYLAWQTGKLFFKDATLSSVVKRLITHYEKQIVIENETLSNCKISLNINNRTLSEVMEDIKKILPIDYEETKEKVIITGEGCQLSNL